MSSLKKYFKITIFTCLIMGLVSAAAAQFFFFPNPLIDKLAPDFTLNTTENDNVKMSDFRGENSAIIFFWATWCPHCRVQLKNLSENKESLDKQNIKVILVDTEENKRIVQSYIEKNKIDYEVFLDKKSEVAELYAIIGVPTFIFLDKDGIVVDVKHSLPEDFSEVISKS